MAQADLRLAQQQQLQQFAAWQELLTAPPDPAVLCTDPSGTILSVNPGAERMLGYRAEELIGQDSPLLLHDPEEVKQRAAALGRELGRPVAAGFDALTARAVLGQPDEERWTYIGKDGRRLPVLLSLTALRRADGTIHHFVGVAIPLRSSRQPIPGRDLMEALSDAVLGVERTPPYRIQFLNPAAEAMFAVVESAVIGAPLEEVLEILPDEGQAAGEPASPLPLNQLFEQDRCNGLELTVRARSHGRHFPMALSLAPLELGEGASLCVLCGQDISERHRLALKQRLSDKVFDSTSEAILITDREGVILSVNEAFTRVTGYSAEEAIGQTPRLLKSGRHPSSFYEAIGAELIKTGTWCGEIWARNRDGVVCPQWITVNAVHERGRTTHYVAVFRDLRPQVEGAQGGNSLARLDLLTALPNRVGLEQEAARALARARRSGQPLMVAFIDLDRFKTVNDSLGHATGDLLLQQVARRLETCVRSTDTVARLGGDEFVVMAEAVGDQNSAAHLAQKLHRALEGPITVDGQELFVTPSIGVCLFPDDGEDILQLMQNADTAMYEVKAQGRNGWLFFTPAMNQAVQERLSLEKALRQGLTEGHFLLHYQPQWQGREPWPIGWEALLRWRHPERGLVPPGTFIPIAEEAGLIPALGEWALLQACTTTHRWQSEGLGRFGISVNLSGRQFNQRDLEHRIEALLEESGLPPDQLELEITESVLMDDAERTNQVLRRLRNKGIQVAIDDFGTGYSSLSYLRSFPVDRLKIDRSFVASSLVDPNGAAIVESIISLARALGLTTIAEGVETEAELNFLLGIGCDQIQGYLLGRPMPAEEIPAFLRQCGPGSA